jgi:hypothetical protein
MTYGKNILTKAKNFEYPQRNAGGYELNRRESWQDRLLK